MKQVTTWLAAIASLVVIVVGIAALIGHNNQWNTQRGRGDAQVGHVDSQPRDVYQMPDRFGNIAEVCDKYGNAIVVTTNTSTGKALWAVKDGCQ